MLFNTFIFLFIFFPTAFLISRVLYGQEKIKGLLILSLIFYGFHNIFNLFILLSSISFNYLSARSNNKNIYFPIIVNLSILFIFKYASSIFNFSFLEGNFILPLGFLLFNKYPI